MKIYRFGFGKADGDSSLVDKLGGKGANLCQMTKLGFPVPPGVIIPTSASIKYLKGDADSKVALITDAVDSVEAWLHEVSEKLGRPVLVSVRSGARVSMPGMMDTILNVGIGSGNYKEWVKLLGPKAAADCASRLKGMYEKTTGKALPDSPSNQLLGSILAVWESWNSERAVAYRKANGFSDNWGTAVTVQVMVLGNLNDNSASGVLFTRDPDEGGAGWGEWLPNSQGEDVVAGTHTPFKFYFGGEGKVLNDAVNNELIGLANRLEVHYRYPQDIEFTVENGEVFLLQTRNIKPTARAAFRIARDLVNEGALGWDEAVKKVSGKQYVTLGTRQIDPAYKVAPNFVGIAGGGGVASGVAVLTKEEAIKSPVPCILVTEETTPDDFPGMLKAAGILTVKGGATSHAAVVARGMDKACVVGVTDLKLAAVAGKKVTIDGATGRVWIGSQVPLIEGSVSAEAEEVLDAALVEKGAYLLAEFTSIGTLPQWSKALAAGIPKAGKVLVRLPSLEGSDPAQVLRRLFNTVLKREELTGVIDLSGECSVQVPGNDKLSEFLGLGAQATGPKPVSPEFVASVLEVLAQTNAPYMKGAKRRWVLKFPKGFHESDLSIAKSYDWVVAKKIGSLADLIALDGGFEIEPGLESSLGVSVGDVLSLLRDAGRVVREVPVNPGRRESLAFEVLG